MASAIAAVGLNRNKGNEAANNNNTTGASFVREIVVSFITVFKLVDVVVLISHSMYVQEMIIIIFKSYSN